jgi:DNA repair exonuclease SbcCD ATPase subunit
MIKFRKVRYKNFLSTGDTFTEIDLARKKNTLIIGANGSGKSTLLDALCFGLFGRAFRKVPKTSLVNSINQKKTVVEVEFSIGRQQYRVMRAIKPNRFEIYLNGKMIHQDANVRDYQAILEQQILKLNFKTFTQVVVLGSSSFTPFMQLVTIERRNIIEDILDIQIFTVMNDVLKQRYASLRHQINEIRTNLKIGDQKIKSQEEAMRRLEENRDELIDKFTKDIIEHEEKIIEHKTNIRSDLHLVQTLNNTISDEEDIREKLSKTLSDERHFESERKKFIRELKFYENNDECPTCKQDIETEHKEHICTDTTSNLKEIDKQLSERGKSIHEINERLEEISKVQAEIFTTQSAIQKEQNSISTNEQYNNKVQRQIDDLKQQQHTEDDKEKLDKYRKAYSQLEDMDKEHIETKHYYDLAEILLRDSGIKTKIIRQYLPIMNKLINKYLASMEFFVQFELDDNFSEQIKSRYRDQFSYSSFSEGEKMRIDLALLFTWRSIAKLKNSVNTNLLILDEVFDSSLDEGGTDEFLKILHTLGDDTNTFIISHKGDSMNEKFNNIIEFEKTQNFSRIKSAWSGKK